MEDQELERIKRKKLEEMMKKQSEVQSAQETGVLELDTSSFDKTISDDIPTLVDFWAEWCGPCRTMHPVFTRLSQKYKKIKFARVNVDQSQQIAQRFGIQSIPTFIMFKEGKLVDKMTGAVGEPGIHMICKKYSIDGDL